VLGFSLNGAPMGSEVLACRERVAEVEVRGGGALHHVELVNHGRPLARHDGPGVPAEPGPDFWGRLVLSLGWGEPGEPTAWHVRLALPL